MGTSTWPPVGTFSWPRTVIDVILARPHGQCQVRAWLCTVDASGEPRRLATAQRANSHASTQQTRARAEATPHHSRDAGREADLRVALAEAAPVLKANHGSTDPVEGRLARSHPGRQPPRAPRHCPPTPATAQVPPGRGAGARHPVRGSRRWLTVSPRGSRPEAAPRKIGTDPRSLPTGREGCRRRAWR